MKRFTSHILLGLAFISTAFAQTLPDRNQTKREVLAFLPIQKDVVIDTPKLDECEVAAVPVEEGSGFVVTGTHGERLRLFLDTNKSGRVNQWSYYRNGVEVYRDIDTNGNGVADQCRYFHTAGTRWGIDANEDRVVDFWKSISAEEVASEVLEALRQQDPARLARVTLNGEQLAALELGDKWKNTLQTKLTNLPQQMVESLKTIPIAGEIEWSQFGGNKPALVPAGRDGNKRDLLVYENALVVFPQGDTTQQISLGTLVAIGDGNWRLIDAPLLDDGKLSRTTFLPGVDDGSAVAAAPAASDVLPLMAELQELQLAVLDAPKAKRGEMYDRLVAIILQVIKQASPSDREMWCRQLADTMLTAVQVDGYVGGVARLESLLDAAIKGQNRELAAYVKNRLIMTQYYLKLSGGENVLQTQMTWLADLEAFAQEYAATEAGSEAALQLATYSEVAGETDKATTWYAKVAEQYEGKPIAEKAKGALRRLTSVGKPVPFQATLADGKPFDIASTRGGLCLLYFWDVNSATPEVLSGLKRVADASRVRVVAVCLEPTSDAAKRLIASQPAFLHIAETGGIDGPSATYWGVPAAPMMILYDASGKVVAQSVESVGVLEGLIKGPAPAQN
ncbi:MAG: hypothetical protein ACRC46_14360 [Thermoguttaceae bacterium]